MDYRSKRIIRRTVKGITAFLFITISLFIAIILILNYKNKKDCIDDLNTELTSSQATSIAARETGGIPISCLDVENDKDVILLENKLTDWKNSNNNPLNYHAVDPKLF